MTIGEVVFASVLSAFMAAVAAALAFVGAIFLCARLLNGEAQEFALIAAPAAAVMSALVVFGISFRKFSP